MVSGSGVGRLGAVRGEGALEVLGEPAGEVTGAVDGPGEHRAAVGGVDVGGQGLRGGRLGEQAGLDGLGDQCGDLRAEGSALGDGVGAEFGVGEVELEEGEVVGEAFRGGDAARQAGLSLAVVSNNPAADIERMLAACDLLAGFDAVVGNDQPGLARKPAPDPYLAAAARLGLPPADCAAIEDSVVGLESARRAGCFTIGVATGASGYDDLVHSGLADVCYRDFRTEG